MPKKIDEAIKLDALSRWARGDDPYYIAREIGVTETTLKNWRNAALNLNFVENVHIKGHENSYREGLPRTNQQLENLKNGSVEGIVHNLQKHPETEEFQTMSIPIASALQLLGHEMKKVTIGPDNKKVMVFKNSYTLQKIVSDYRSGELQGSLKAFENEIYNTRKKVMI